MTLSPHGGVQMIRVDAAAIDALVDEIRRYLTVLDAFRREGCEPRWRETTPQEEVLS